LQSANPAKQRCMTGQEAAQRPDGGVTRPADCTISHDSERFRTIAVRQRTMSARFRAKSARIRPIPARF
jgi:hypothetical protein